jgi:(R,R)-butanediol dehydrogenase/meso-butanediol dehydrogenase/diacetyl reductase
MRAAVYHAREDLRIEEVAEADPGPGQVKIAVSYNGLCGSDLYEYYYGPLGIPTSPHPLTGAMLPQIMGHEFGGRVVATGPGVEDLAIGDLVAVNPMHVCGTCVYCRRGDTNLCVTAAFHGLMAHGGGLSDFTVVDRRMAHVMPPGLTARDAAVVEPMAVALRSARRAAVSDGQSVVVFGAGPIGLGAYFACRWLGAEPIMVEPSAARRAILTDLGAPAVLDPTADDVTSAVLDLTGGVGAHAAIDAAATPATFAAAFSTTRRGGVLSIVGIAHEPLPLDPITMFQTEITVRASNAYADDFPMTIRAMAEGAYPLDGWVTTIELHDVIESGFEVLHAGKAMKILVRLGGDDVPQGSES